MIREVVTGEIGKFGGDIVFISKDRVFQLNKSIEVEHGDIVIGYIKDREVPKVYEDQPITVQDFQLIAKTKRQFVRKDVLARSIIKFVNYHRYNLDRFWKWTPLNQNSMFSKSRVNNLIYARHLYMFLARFISGKTLTQVGKECRLKNSNHATVINAEKKMKNRLATNMHLAVNLQALIDDCTKKD